MILFLLVFQRSVCCPGYFGHMCEMCPGKPGQWCSGNGECQDGIQGSGECRCLEGFHGTACEMCEVGRYGADCKAGDTRGCGSLALPKCLQGQKSGHISTFRRGGGRAERSQDSETGQWLPGLWERDSKRGALVANHRSGPVCILKPSMCSAVL